MSFRPTRNTHRGSDRLAVLGALGWHPQRSVAERIATERGGALGDTVAYKIRFEDRRMGVSKNVGALPGFGESP